MEQLNFWCRWCGSRTDHAVSWLTTPRLATVTTRCSICGATGTGSIAMEHGPLPTPYEPPPVDQAALTAAIHEALSRAKKVEE